MKRATTEYTGKATVQKTHKRRPPGKAQLSIPARPRKRPRTSETIGDHELIDQPCRLCGRPELAPANMVVLCGLCVQRSLMEAAR